MKSTSSKDKQENIPSNTSHQQQYHQGLLFQHIYWSALSSSQKHFFSFILDFVMFYRAWYQVSLVKSVCYTDIAFTALRLCALWRNIIQSKNNKLDTSSCSILSYLDRNLYRDYFSNTTHGLLSASWLFGLGDKESTNLSNSTQKEDEEFRKRIKDGGGKINNRTINKRVAILYFCIERF